MVEGYWLLVGLKEENALRYLTNTVIKGNKDEPVTPCRLVRRQIVTMSNTFKKEERLCSKRLIDSLFHNGSSFVVYPYRVVFLLLKPTMENRAPAQCIISVPKRRFRKAVDRNQIKRRMREGYRLQKADLYSFLREHSLHLFVAFQYVSKEKEPYALLYQRMEKVLAALKNEHIPNFLGKSD